ncbi:PAS domain S-box protein [Chryseobacterium sp. SN22]|uniref:ATP-binding protein n=1 Tax=Chryseobacterium sp. SN22 TaxID=2606431 RepID=UPI0011F0084B|nr:ATP-binding protein [Chryseobacterium sp. SN22]KAA0129319.1 PAS domain S-box protein [Chryseobacterium sp. SN22]
MSDINPSEEQKRLAALRSYHILDTAAEKDFDELTELAAAICNTPIALISLVDEDRQWFKSHHGMEARQTDRCHSFCSHAIEHPETLMQVEDAMQDPRFSDNPLVTGNPDIRFYAGMPLVDEKGYALGSLCVIDQKPGYLNEAQQKALRTLARQVIDKLSLRKRNIELLTANEKLEQANRYLTETEEKLKTTNTELADSKEWLQTILDIVGEGIGITDEKGNTIYTNKRSTEIFNVEGETLFSFTGSTAWENRRPDGSPLPAEEHPVTIALRTGSPITNFVFMVSDRQGSSVYLCMNATPIKDKEGKITGAVVSFSDITESYLLQEQLKDREERLQMAISSANLGTWHMDAETRKFFPSPRLKELFGYYPDEEMPYDAAFAQIADSHRQQIIDAVETSVIKGEPYELEYPIIGYHDKKLRWVCATGHLYTRAENPLVSHFSGTMADITERKLDEQRRSDFIGMVSHELKNPLTAIGGYTYLLLKRAQKNNDEMVSEAAVKLNRQIKRMEALINGFLDVARLGEGKIQLNRSAFDMAGLVRIAEEESLATITSHKVVFAPVDFTPVEADKDKIEQVLVNFINNAVKYSPEGSTINVSCVTKEGRARVCVTDEGMGIPVKDQPFVFDRFYRVESEGMKNKKGFGIGLYICKEIVARHHGEIGVESTEGKGSTFWFTLPVANP